MSATGEMAIVQRLLVDTTVSTLVSTRIYPNVAPQKTAADALDYIVYSVASEDHEHHMKGASGLVFTRVQLDIVAATYLRAKAIANAVRLTLDGYRGPITVGDDQVFVQHCFLILVVDNFDPPVDASQRGRHRVIQDYRVGYEEQIPAFAGV